MLELIQTYGPRFIEGFVTTMELVLLSVVLGLMIAVPVALARMSRNPLIAWPVYAYSFFFRGTPLLIQFFLLYYGLAQFESLQETTIWVVLKEAWWCGLIGLTLNTAAYTSEIIRGGMLAVPHGEIEAAQACGMTKAKMYRRIILPKAFRIAWPAYGNEIVFLLKGSALLSTITVLDLMGQARVVFARGYDLNAYVVAGVMYFVMIYLFDIGWRLTERRLNRYLGERPSARAKPARATT